MKENRFMSDDKDLRDVYNKIPKSYDRANALISFFQDVK